jgi:hypothetical protein
MNYDRLHDFLRNTFHEAFRRFHANEEEGYSSEHYYEDLESFRYDQLADICHKCPSSKKYVEEFGIVKALRIFHKHNNHDNNSDLLDEILEDENAFYGELLWTIAVWADGYKDSYEAYKAFRDHEERREEIGGRFRAMLRLDPQPNTP